MSLVCVGAVIVKAKTVPIMIRTRLILAIVFIIITPTANALDGLSLNIGTIAGVQWKLEGINIALTDLVQNPQKIILTINKLSLPIPFNDLTLVNIRCTSFTWQNKELLCEQGRAQMHSIRWQSPAADFSFHITKKLSSFKLTDLHLASGTVEVVGEERGDQWQLQINARAVDGKLIQQLLPQERFKLKAGKTNVKFTAFGSHALLSLRMEKGFGIWAREYRPIYGPEEAQLKRFVRLDKGDFIGREAAMAERGEGGERRLVLFEVDARDADAFGDEPIWHGGKVVGWITSGGYGHTVGKSLALGYVPGGLAGQASGFEIEIIGERCGARILAAPPYDPSGSRMRG